MNICHTLIRFTNPRLCAVIFTKVHHSEQEAECKYWKVVGGSLPGGECRHDQARNSTLPPWLSRPWEDDWWTPATDSVCLATFWLHLLMSTTTKKVHIYNDKAFLEETCSKIGEWRSKAFALRTTTEQVHLFKTTPNTCSDECHLCYQISVLSILWVLYQ